jgi:hypothetical protein
VAGHTYNRDVAAIGRAACLIRSGRRASAVDACRQLIDTLRAAGMWPQVWTTLRLVAELLADLDDPAPAAVLLASAEADPRAPAVLNADRVRQHELRRRIAWRVSPAKLAARMPGGPALPAATAADLAVAALDRHRLRGIGRQPASSRPATPAGDRGTHDNDNPDHPGPDHPSPDRR